MSMVAVTLLAFSALVDCRSSSQSDVEVTLTQKALSFEQKDLSDVEGRIVGGRIVEPAHKYPFQVLYCISELVIEIMLLPDLLFCWGLCLCWEYTGHSPHLNSSSLSVQS